jgi:hypothetical protein
MMNACYSAMNASEMRASPFPLSRDTCWGHGCRGFIRSMIAGGILRSMCRSLLAEGGDCMLAYRNLPVAIDPSKMAHNLSQFEGGPFQNL